MRKIICLVIALTMLFLTAFEVTATDKTVKEADFKILSANSNEPTKLRTRKQVEGLRLYVDEENPLFMIRKPPNLTKS